MTQSAAVANGTQWPPAGLDNHGDREVVIPVPGGPETTTMRAWVRKPRLVRAPGSGRLDGRVEVEARQGLPGTEPGRPNPEFGAGGVAGRNFPLQDRGQVVLETPQDRGQ